MGLCTLFPPLPSSLWSWLVIEGALSLHLFLAYESCHRPKTMGPTDYVLEPSNLWARTGEIAHPVHSLRMSHDLSLCPHNPFLKIPDMQRPMSVTPTRLLWHETQNQDSHMEGLRPRQPGNRRAPSNRPYFRQGGDQGMTPDTCTLSHNTHMDTGLLWWREAYFSCPWY